MNRAFHGPLSTNNIKVGNKGGQRQKGIGIKGGAMEGFCLFPK